jgi:HSP20 family molecular chaperone IbpA
MMPFAPLRRWIDDVRTRSMFRPKWAPRADVVVRDGGLRIRTDLAGMKLANINVTDDRDVLTTAVDRRDRSAAHFAHGNPQGQFATQRDVSPHRPHRREPPTDRASDEGLGE